MPMGADDNESAAIVLCLSVFCAAISLRLRLFAAPRYSSKPALYYVGVVLLLLVPPLFIEGNSHSYNRTIFVFARATVPY